MHTPSSFKPQQGFTLLELMFTIAVAAILAAIAVPSLQQIIINRHADRLANELQIDIMYARNQALSLNQEVTIKPLTGGWDTGWVIKQNNNIIRQKGSAAAPMAKEAGEITSTDFTSTDLLTFDKQGRAKAAGSITVKVAKCKGDRVREIKVNYIGQLQVVNSAC